MTTHRLLVTSTVPDSLNNNACIRKYAALGFAEVLGDENVIERSFDSATAAILDFKPDVIFAVGGVGIDEADLRHFRRAADKAGATLAFWLHDDPYEFDYAFRAEAVADIIFTNDSWALHHYNVKNVHHLPMAGCPHAHLRNILPSERRRHISVFFCGVGYPNRVDLLRRASDLLARHSTVVTGAHWPDDLPFAGNERLTPTEMADHAQQSLMTLNIGRDLDIANARYQLPPSTPGPRTFEVALSGSAQIYFVHGFEISRYFDPESEIILFDSVADLAALLERSYDEPAYFIAIAEAAQRRALNEHCYRHRASTVLATIFPGSQNIS